MGKRKNVASTQQVTIATTPQAFELLERLARGGLHGKNAAAVAEELLRQKLREIVTEGKFLGEETGSR